MSLDILLIDRLDDYARTYYARDKWGRRNIDTAALGLYMMHKRSSLYADIYEAFKIHYKEQFYNKQKELTKE